MNTRSSSIAHKTRGATKKARSAASAKAEVTAAPSRSGRRRTPSRKAAQPSAARTRTIAVDAVEDAAEDDANPATRGSKSVVSVSVAPTTRRRAAASATIASEPSSARRSQRAPVRGKAVAAPVAASSSRQDEAKLRKLEKELQKKQDVLKRKEDQHKAAVSELETSTADLTARENALTQNSDNLAQRELLLQPREAILARKEQEAADLLASVNATRAEQVLAELEESFSCSLCYEIVACPCLLTSPQCGHTFCAACILQWFFSHLHDDCGGFHETVECPLCRSALCRMPTHGDGRTIFSCPFTLNRLTDKVIGDKLEILRTAGPSSVSNPSPSSARKQTAAETADPSIAWREGGSARAEWLARDRKGRDELKLLAAIWIRASPQDFRSFKGRLSS